MKYGWLLPGLVLLLVSCAAPQVPSPADRAVERWRGKPIARVIDSWGAPSEKLETAEGEVYSWEASAYQSSNIPANLAPGTTYAYGPRRELNCRAVFEVDNDGIVTRAEWQGYECYGLP